MTQRPEWWRFTGIGGLRRFMPDRIIQMAEKKKLGWLKWYEPVCKTCHPIKDELVKTVVEAETDRGLLTITQTNGVYTIVVDGVTRYFNIDANSALQTMAHYLHTKDSVITKDDAKRLIIWCGHFSYEMTTEVSAGDKWEGLEDKILDAFLSGKASSDESLISSIPYLG